MGRNLGNIALATFVALCCSMSLVEAKPKVLPGHVAKSNVQEVNSKIKWHTNLNSALGQAKREGKMVLWIHMIGKVDGAT